MAGLHEQEPSVPKITTSLVRINGTTVEIPHLNGKAYREPVDARLGNRYVCGQGIESREEIEITHPDTGKIEKTVRQKFQYYPGTVIAQDGSSIYLGCNSETLCIRPSSSREELVDNTGPNCCEMPMSIVASKILPSAD